MLQHRQNHTIVDVYVALGRAKGNLLDPFLELEVHIGHIRVIPKKSQPGQCHMIADLAYPQGISVNDAIDVKLCSLSYVTIIEVMREQCS